MIKSLIVIILLSTFISIFASKYDLDDEIESRMEACDTFKSKELRGKCLNEIANHLSPISEQKRSSKKSHGHSKKHCRWISDKDQRYSCYGLVNKRTKSTYNKSDAYQLVTRAITVIKQKPNWARLEIKRATHSDYSLIIWYKNNPKAEKVVEADTKLVARAVLKEVIASGINPKKGYVGVFVRGYKKSRGVHHNVRIQRFGRTHYDFKTGQFIFDADAK